MGDTGFGGLFATIAHIEVDDDEGPGEGGEGFGFIPSSHWTLQNMEPLPAPYGGAVPQLGCSMGATGAVPVSAGGDWAPNGGSGGINAGTPPTGSPLSPGDRARIQTPPPQSLVLVPDSFGLFLNNQLQIKVQNLRHPKFPSRGRDSQCWKCSNAGGAHGPPHNIWRWQQSPLSPPSRFRGTRTSPAHLELEMLEPPSTSWGARSPPKTPEDAGTPNREVLRGPQVLTT